MLFWNLVPLIESLFEMPPQYCSSVTGKCSLLPKAPSINSFQKKMVWPGFTKKKKTHCYLSNDSVGGSKKIKWTEQISLNLFNVGLLKLAQFWYQALLPLSTAPLLGTVSWVGFNYGLSPYLRDWYDCIQGLLIIISLVDICVIPVFFLVLSQLCQFSWSLLSSNPPSATLGPWHFVSLIWSAKPLTPGVRWRYFIPAFFSHTHGPAGLGSLGTRQPHM